MSTFICLLPKLGFLRLSFHSSNNYIIPKIFGYVHKLNPVGKVFFKALALIIALYFFEAIVLCYLSSKTHIYYKLPKSQ